MTEKKYPRRDFLNLAWGAIGVLAISESLFVGLQFLAPRSSDGEFGGEFNLGPNDLFPVGSVTPVEPGNFYLVRLQDGGFLAVYRRCTHLGCSVPYDPALQQFVCPCHGSAFSSDGDVLTAPAPRPLDLFALIIDDAGEIIVDSGTTIEREKASPEHIVYWGGV